MRLVLSAGMPPRASGSDYCRVTSPVGHPVSRRQIDSTDNAQRRHWRVAGTPDKVGYPLRNSFPTFLNKPVALR
jgi:hypothetical protein